MAGLRIGSNIESLNVQRRLAEATSTLELASERLSSGQRINRASDDAAGLAIGAGLNAKSRVYGQAIRNINDGLSLTNIADSALEMCTGIIERQKELVFQAANGAYSSQQRQAINKEAKALTEEFNRIISTASFNGRSLFTTAQDSSGVRIQVGIGSEESISFSLGAQIARNVGDGTFVLGGAVTYGTNPFYISAGDLNNDGLSDVVSQAVGGARVFLSNGDGTFQAAGALSTLSNNGTLIADLDRDGNNDLVVGDWWKLDIFWGNGDGTFAAPTVINMSGVASDLRSGDFNGDGFLDLAASAATTSNAVSIFTGTGRSNWSVSSVINFNVPKETAIGDFNHDGKADLAALDYGADTVNIFYGRGNGTFAAGPVYAYADTNQAECISAGDFNADGNQDLVIGGWGGTDKLLVLLGNSDGTFAKGPLLAAPGGYERAVFAVDIDGNGRLDILSTEESSGHYYYYSGSGDGTFESAVATSPGLSIAQSALGDFNGDGRIDIASNAYTDPGLMHVQFGRGGQTMNTPYLNLSTAEDARAAMAVLDAQMDSLQGERGAIGAVQSRLMAALNNIHALRQNYEAAEARIVDTDVAEEAANRVRADVRQRAAAMILMQANQTPALALELLRG